MSSVELECVSFTPECLKCVEICAKVERMNARKRLTIRLMLSLIFGLIVASVALTSVGGAHSRDIRFEQKNTRYGFERIDMALAKYHAQNGRYPKTLNELKLDWLAQKDGWRRDWIYSLADGKPIVESLGRDGKRGGIGTDSDLSNRNPRPPQTRVPLWMRAREPDAKMMVVSALFCGLLAGVLTVAALEKVTFAAKDLIILVPALLTALAMAAFGAAVITLFHMPSGH